MIAAFRKLNGGVEADIIKEYASPILRFLSISSPAKTWVVRYQHYAGAKRREWDEHFIRTLSIPVLTELLRVGPSTLAGKTLAAQQFRLTVEANLALERQMTTARYPTPPESDFDDEERWQPEAKWMLDDGTEEEMNPS